MLLVSFRLRPFGSIKLMQEDHLNALNSLGARPHPTVHTNFSGGYCSTTGTGRWPHARARRPS